MKILYDFQTFVYQEFGGISNYFSSLISRLAAIPGPVPVLPLSFSNNVNLGPVPGVAPRRFLPGISFRGKARVLFYLNQPACRRELRSGRYHMFHPTYYHPWFLRHLGNTPFVLTIYDMIHERMPELFAAGDWTPGAKKMVAERADRIIAISRSTARDVVELLGIPEERIDVVPLASSLVPEGAPLLPDLPEHYLLYVGVRLRYKNFRPFLEAIRPLLLGDGAPVLLCAGGDPFTRDELQLIRSFGLQRRVVQRGFQGQELATLYSHARCFVFPSLYEGFGIPLLEAFACGCPVAAANSSSLPEVAGDAALLFDPVDQGEIHAAVARLLHDDALCARLRRQGHKRVAQFSWQETARRTLECYRRALQGRSRA